MSVWTSMIDVAARVASDGAEKLPAAGAETLSLQTRVFGFGATTIGAEAEAIVNNIPVPVALTAVAIGVAAVAALPEAALAAAVVPVVEYALPILGGAISRAALTSIVQGVFEVGVAGISESAAAPVLMRVLDVSKDYAWALKNPDVIRQELSLPEGLSNIFNTNAASPGNSTLTADEAFNRLPDRVAPGMPPEVESLVLFKGDRALFDRQFDEIAGYESLDVVQDYLERRADMEKDMDAAPDMQDNTQPAPLHRSALMPAM